MKHLASANQPKHAFALVHDGTHEPWESAKGSGENHPGRDHRDHRSIFGRKHQAEKMETRAVSLQRVWKIHENSSWFQNMRTSRNRFLAQNRFQVTHHPETTRAQNQLPEKKIYELCWAWNWIIPSFPGPDEGKHHHHRVRFGMANLPGCPSIPNNSEPRQCSQSQRHCTDCMLSCQAPSWVHVKNRLTLLFLKPIPESCKIYWLTI